MRSIRTRPIYDSGFPQIAFGSGEGSYLTTETVAGSAQVGQAVARALRGERSLTILIDGDSLENAYSDGYLTRGARNIALLATQDASLVRSGFVPLGFSTYTTTIPVRTNAANGNNLTSDLGTNLALRSQELGTSPWTADASGSGSVVPTRTNNDDTAPDGTQTATRIQFTRGASGFSRVQQTLTSTASQAHTMSVWMKLKSGSTSVGVGLRIGGDGTYVTNHTVTSTWQRFSYTVPAVGQPDTNVTAQIMLWSSIAGNSTSADILVWGCQLEQKSSRSSYIPTTTATGTHLAILQPLLPASWLDANSHPIYSVPSGTSTAGGFASLQSRGTHVHPGLGVAAGDETPWWSQTDGETFCDIYLLKQKLDGYGAEVTVRVTATDTLAGFASVNAVQTYTSGSGGLSALNLNADEYTTGTVAVIRIPITFKDSGNTTRLASQLNITGSGGKVAVCGVEFVRPNFKGLAFSTISGRSGYKLSDYVNSHGNAGPAYKVIADQIRSDGGDVAYMPRAGVNDCYVAPTSTATQFATTVQNRITQIRANSCLGANTPIILCAPTYRDSNTNSADANDAEYDKYASVLRNIATQGLGNILALNLRKYLHKMGFNRGSENPFLSGSLWTIPTSRRGGAVAGIEGVDQWRLNGLNPVTTLVDYSYASGTLSSFSGAGNMVSVSSAAGASDHPFVSGNGKWYARRQWLIVSGAAGITEPAKTATDSITNITSPDQVHYSGRANFLVRMAELNLLIQAASNLATNV